MPMINEAIFCLYHGVGTKEDIDTVMKLGMNHPMGPLALADLIGPGHLPGDHEHPVPGAG
jgi:3-hydroxybutyryl-CoA dehydrogenase